MNLPPGQDKTLDEWVPTLHDDVLAQRGKSCAENPDPCSAVVLTNFSWHWHGEETTEGGERFLVLPFFQEIPLPGPENRSHLEVRDPVRTSSPTLKGESAAVAAL